MVKLTKLEEIHQQLSALTIRHDKYVDASTLKYLVAQVVRIVEEVQRIEKERRGG